MLTISEDVIRNTLKQENPWWTGGSIDQTAASYKPRAYLDPLLHLVTSLYPTRAVVLMGPRRVGKTFLIRHVIQSLLKSGSEGHDILYASLDSPVYTGCHLDQLLMLGETATGSGSKKLKYVFFDEVQYLPDWERHLKVLVDRFPKVKFVVSGSAAAALKRKSQESGAGRFTDMLLPPLTFYEYLSLKGFYRNPMDFLDSGMSGSPEEAELIGHMNREFVSYINFGGYPEVALSPIVQQNPNQFVGRDIVEKVLRQDLPSLYGIDNPLEMNRLFSVLAFNTGQEVSLEGLSTSSNVGKTTLQKYMEYLEAAFLIVRLPKLDENGRRFRKQRNFKVYLTNPSLRAGLFGPANEDSPEFGALVETAICAQLFHSPNFRNYSYGRWHKEEIDFVYSDPATWKPLQAFEVKWSDRTEEWQKAAKAICRFLSKNGIQHDYHTCVTTKSTMGQVAYDSKEIVLLPTAWHCWYLGRIASGDRTIDMLEKLERDVRSEKHSLLALLANKQ